MPTTLVNIAVWVTQRDQSRTMLFLSVYLFYVFPSTTKKYRENMKMDVSIWQIFQKGDDLRTDMSLFENHIRGRPIFLVELQEYSVLDSVINHSFFSWENCGFFSIGLYLDLP